MKIVLDTSVLIAAFYQPLAGPSFSKEVYDYIVQYEKGYISAYILDEFREKCAKKLKLGGSQISILETLLRKKLHVEPMQGEASTEVHLSLRDPKDRPILELTMAVRADILLTWDKDLLVLKKIGSAHIVTPREFWEMVSNVGPV